MRPARTIHALPPNYPALAGVSGTTGSVEVLVSLNENGDVRSATAFANTLGDRPGSGDAVRAAIVSAAA